MTEIATGFLFTRHSGKSNIKNNLSKLAEQYCDGHKKWRPSKNLFQWGSPSFKYIYDLGGNTFLCVLLSYSFKQKLFPGKYLSMWKSKMCWVQRHPMGLPSSSSFFEARWSAYRGHSKQMFAWPVLKNSCLPPYINPLSTDYVLSHVQKWHKFLIKNARTFSVSLRTPPCINKANPALSTF